jgi:Domain of unknown function DUF29
MSEYDTDFYGWTQTQAAALRAKDWPALDVAHLAEEIEDLGSNHRFAIESQLERLLLHLLKWRYNITQDPRRLWRLTIRHARREIARRARGSLQGYPARYLAEASQYARDDAPDATGCRQRRSLRRARGRSSGCSMKTFCRRVVTYDGTTNHISSLRGRHCPPANINGCADRCRLLCRRWIAGH